MPKGPNMTGLQFGRLTVLSRADSDKHGNSRWLCACQCGTQTRVIGNVLRRGATVSCGCFARDHAGEQGTTHGASHTPAYKAWHAMTQRCSNPSNHKWARYGGRGIKVCHQWRDYAVFLRDMGERPRGMTLDRRDNDGHYEPGNCRWATPLEQASNRGNNVLVNVAGELMTATAASLRLGTNRSTVSRRVRDGWAPDVAANTPLHQHQGEH